MVVCVCVQYIAVSRSAFCYHYMPGLLYGELLLAIMLDALAESIATRFKFAMHVTVIVASALGLAYWAPWVYALELTRQGANDQDCLELLRMLSMLFILLETSGR